MIVLWLHLAIMLIIILIASQLFTNALEYFSAKIGISAGLTGSIFAAIATALPETVIPILALIAGTSSKITNEEISVGAILGAPLMLSTLAICILGIAASQKRGMKGYLQPELSGTKRDLHFFILAFIIAACALFAPHNPAYLRIGMSLGLIGLYFCYLLLTIRASKTLVKNGHGICVSEPLLFSLFGFTLSTRMILLQLIAGLVLLLLGAKGFIDSVENISHTMQLSPLLLSLIVIPFATELPEKVNSILWVRKNKDTLAFGNITGAMVFQGTLLPALGILLTPWEPSHNVVVSISVTLIATIWLRMQFSHMGLRLHKMLINGLLYMVFLLALVY